jgi:hypothetical protein
VEAFPIVKPNGIRRPAAKPTILEQNSFFAALLAGEEKMLLSDASFGVRRPV